MILVIDIGNSRLKWATFHNANLQQSHALNNEALNTAKLIELWKHLPTPRKLALACVSAKSLVELVTTVANELWPSIITIQVKSEAYAFGVHNGYIEPEKLGVDRWLALIAVRNYYPKGSCIIDCGTAITIDFIDADGNHQGGMISPGLTLMKKSLAIATDLLMFNEDNFSTGPANFTEAAIYSGTLNAATGLIKSALSTQDSSLTVILTGGDADMIAKQLSFNVVIDSNLVLLGLALVASNSSH
ncbi:MAG: type III pantothenate kinase [Methylococcales bacterium]|nr:MAG: type III pantothenate kinase [Methylococcales bacterium]